MISFLDIIIKANRVASITGLLKKFYVFFGKGIGKNYDKLGLI